MSLHLVPARTQAFRSIAKRNLTVDRQPLESRRNTRALGRDSGRGSHASQGERAARLSRDSRSGGRTQSSRGGWLQLLPASRAASGLVT